MNDEIASLTLAMTECSLMYELNIYSKDGKIVGKEKLPDEIFGSGRGLVNQTTTLLNEAVRFYQASKRMGTASTKTRGEVRGGGRKPWRQKGTGRARAGSRRSPIWVGGGITFGPKPRDYTYHFSKKKKRLALFFALSIKAKQGKILLLDKLDMKNIKTKLFQKIVHNIGLNKEKRCLFLLSVVKENVYKSGRNIRGIEFKDSISLNALDVMTFNTLVFTTDGLKAFVTRVRDSCSLPARETSTNNTV